MEFPTYSNVENQLKKKLHFLLVPGFPILKEI